MSSYRWPPPSTNLVTGQEYRWPTKGTVVPPAWTPASEAGLSFWFRADTLTSSGGVVTSWTDKSGNGRDATPSGSPTLVSSVVNGQDVVRLVSASTQYLTFAPGSTFALKNSAYTLFIFLKYAAPVSLGNFEVVLSMNSDGGVNTFTTYFASNVATYSPLAVGGGTATVDTNTGVTTDYSTSFFGLTSLYNGGGSFSTGANYVWQKNGVSLGALTNGAGGVNTGSAINAIGLYPGGGLYPNVDIAEIAFWDHALDATAQTNLNAYRLSRYAI